MAFVLQFDNAIKWKIHDVHGCSAVHQIDSTVIAGISETCLARFPLFDKLCHVNGHTELLSSLWRKMIFHYSIQIKRTDLCTCVIQELVLPVVWSRYFFQLNMLYFCIVRSGGNPNLVQVFDRSSKILVIHGEGKVRGEYMMLLTKWWFKIHYKNTFW